MSAARGARPTLSQVAGRAGVSPSTVSRVVRGSTPVSPELERAVRAAIAEVGYTPNLAARQLVTSRSDTVGVVIPEDQRLVFREPFFAAMIEGVADALSATPYRFELARLMAATIEGKPTRKRIVMPTELVVRATA